MTEVGSKMSERTKMQYTQLSQGVLLYITQHNVISKKLPPLYGGIEMSPNQLPLLIQVSFTSEEDRCYRNCGNSFCELLEDRRNNSTNTWEICFSLINSSTLTTWCEELTHLKRPWCWEKLRAGREWDNRGWNGWMASLTQWTWVWIHSGSWRWTGRPGMLQSMVSQKVGHDWVTKLKLNSWWIFRLLDILAIVKSAVMNFGVDISFWTMLFSRYRPKSEISGSYVSSIFSFSRTLPTFPHSGCIIYLNANGLNVQIKRNSWWIDLKK